MDTAARPAANRTAIQDGSAPPVPQLLIGLAATAFAPGLFGPFVLDDHVNLAPIWAWLNGQLDWLSALVGNESGPGRRPLAYLSFMANAALSGESSFGFKLTNLVLHLATGWILYQVLLRLLSAAQPSVASPAWLPAALAALWAIHPLQASTVLYIVQRMEILSSLAQLLAVLAYLEGRSAWQSAPRRSALLLCFGVPAALMAGMAAKENALLALPLILAIEWIVFRPPRPPTILYGLAIGLGTLLATAALVLLLWPDWLLGGYSGREFSLFERLISQPRILLSYLAATLWPVGENLYLFRDGFPLSKGWLQPVSTVLAAIAIFALVAAVIALRNRQAMVALGIAWWLICHSLEASFLPLEPAFEHRNYLALAGLAMVLAPMLIRLSRVERRLPVIAAGVLGLALWGTSLQRAHAWGDLDRLLIAEAPPNEAFSRRLQITLIARGLETSRPEMTEGALGSLEAAGPDNRAIGLLWRAILDCGLRGELDGTTRESLSVTAPSVITHQHISWLGMLYRRTEGGACQGFSSADLHKLAAHWIRSASKPPSRATADRLAQQIGLPQGSLP